MPDAGCWNDVLALCQHGGKGVPEEISTTPVVAAHAFNSKTWKTEAGGALSSRSTWSTEKVRGQLGLHREPLFGETKQLKKTNNFKKEGRKEKRLSPEEALGGKHPKLTWGKSIYLCLQWGQDPRGGAHKPLAITRTRTLVCKPERALARRYLPWLGVTWARFHITAADTSEHSRWVSEGGIQLCKEPFNCPATRLQRLACPTSNEQVFRCSCPSRQLTLACF